MNTQSPAAMQYPGTENPDIITPLTTGGNKPAPTGSDSKVKRFIGAAAGNLIEYFDFYIYAYFNHYFTESLTLPTWDKSTAEIYVWSVFAAGFFTRLLGSWFFGRFGDRYGRRPAMICSISLMVVCSAAFAALPTWQTVGVWAPVLLAAVRLLQGFAVGGEYGAVTSYVSELSKKGRRSFASSLLYVMIIGGQLLAILVADIMLRIVGEDSIRDWAWRVPFAIGALGAAICLIARLRLKETMTEEAMNHEGSGSLAYVLKNYRKSFLIIMGLTAATSLMFYLLTTYTQTYFKALGVPTVTATNIVTIGLLVFMLAQPVAGIIGDKIGPRRMIITFAVLSIFLVYPVMAIAVPHFKDNYIMLGALLVFMMLVLSMYTSVTAIMKAGLFPAHLRAIGHGVSFGLTLAIFGGTATPVALVFKNGGWGNGFYVYATVMLVICLFCAFKLPKDSPYLDTETHH